MKDSCSWHETHYKRMRCFAIVFTHLIHSWQEQGCRRVPEGSRRGRKEHPHTSAPSIRGYLFLLLTPATHATALLISFPANICGMLFVVSRVAQPGACGCDVVRTVDGRVLRLHSQGAAFQYTRDVTTTTSGSVLRLRFGCQTLGKTGLPRVHHKRLCNANPGAWQPNCQPSSCPSLEFELEASNHPMNARDFRRTEAVKRPVPVLLE